MMKRNEKGRSMVEMLGVLAIIGVLSIGGIAGYTMAMNRYRANEIMQFVSLCGVTAMTANSGTGVDAVSDCNTLLDTENPYALSSAQTGIKVNASKITIKLDASYQEAVGSIIDQVAAGKVTGTCTANAGCTIQVDAS